LSTPKKKRAGGNDGRDLTKVTKKCPKCGKTKPVDPGFGVREVNGNVRVQTWCRACRGGTKTN
jgi:hypothetical protein